MRQEINDALDELEREAKIAQTHDIGQLGAERLRAIALLLRRFLWGVVCIILALWAASCKPTPAPAGGADLVSAPGVSAPVVERVGRELRPEATPTPAPGAAALMAMPADPAWNCQAYARTLIPWKGPSFTDPAFQAASDATLPDAPEFAARRATGCALLAARAGTGQ